MNVLIRTSTSLFTIGLLFGLCSFVINSKSLFVKTSPIVTKIIHEYTPAQSPKEAMERFCWAIQHADYENASLYLTDPYGKVVRESHKKAVELADHVNMVRGHAQKNRLMTEKCNTILEYLHPFPATFSVSPNRHKVSDEEVYGIFTSTQKAKIPPLPEIGLDRDIFRNVLMPEMPENEPTFNYRVKIVRTEDDGKNIWKLDIGLTPGMQKKLDRFQEMQHRYIFALDTMMHRLREEVNYATKYEFERDLIQILLAQNRQ